MQGSRLPLPGLALLLLLAGAGCDGTPGSGHLGSAFPDAQVVDPDAPVYQDDVFTQAEVEQLFADAKAANNDTYRGYVAARDHAALLEWAFCACGCDYTAGHFSSVDCFKSLHAFW